jgi:hypothetical protein
VNPLNHGPAPGIEYADHLGRTFDDLSSQFVAPAREPLSSTPSYPSQPASPLQSTPRTDGADRPHGQISAKRSILKHSRLELSSLDNGVAQRMTVPADHSIVDTSEHIFAPHQPSPVLH